MIYDMILTSIMIREDQKEGVEKNYFKLSKFVRNRLDDEIIRCREEELSSIGLYTGTPNKVEGAI